MSSSTRLLVKILVAVVSYGVAFGLAIYAFNQFTGGNAGTFTWIILIILAIFGFRATKYLPFISFSGGANGEGFVYTIIMLFLRVVLSVIAGVFIAPWVIAKKLVSLIPGGEVQEMEEAEEE